MRPVKYFEAQVSDQELMLKARSTAISILGSEWRSVAEYRQNNSLVISVNASDDNPVKLETLMLLSMQLGTDQIFLSPDGGYIQINIKKIWSKP